MSENSAAEAAKTEVAETETVSFEFDDQTYTVEKDCMDDAVVYEAVETDHYATVAKHVLGPGQWKVFTLKRRRAGDLLAMVDAIAKAVADGSLGESKG